MGFPSTEPLAPARETHEERLPLGTIIAYSAPVVGYGYLFFLVTLYFFKFSTDVLRIAPAVIGLIFGLSRIWDAVSDPVAGYFSDRTGLRLGRRRPWLLAAALPIAIIPVMMWSPPGFLEGNALSTWMAISVFLFYTSTTIFGVPHASLGAELSVSYHERTRIFAFRHIGFSIGILLSIGGLYWLIRTAEKRDAALLLAVAGGTVTALLILYATARLRERPEHRGRGAKHPWRGFGDVLRNPHARLLLLVFLIENLGVASLAVLGPYVTQYIVGDESLFPILILSYLGPSVLFVPLGIPLSRRIGKKNLWAASMILSGLAFGSLFFVTRENYLWLCLCGAAAGIGNAFGSMVGPSIQADVIDYDEYTTGERKEGVYFAAWNFVFKSAHGLALMVTGFVLALVGYEPNAQQSEATEFALRALFSLLPFACYGIGVILFLRFRLTEAEHRRIRAVLDTRAGQLGATDTPLRPTDASVQSG